jgi:DNA replication protein DnaC
MNQPHDPHSTSDVTMHQIAPSDLPIPGSAVSSPRSHASTSSHVHAAARGCAICQGWGQLLEDAARARADGLLVLDHHMRFDGRRFAFVPCACAAGQQLIAQWQQLPLDAEGVTLEALFDIPAQDQAIAAVEWFCQQGALGWLTFGGDYGVGKTALLYATLNHLAQQRRYGRFTTAPELIDKLRGLVRQGGDAERYLQRWIDAPLIAIDELDKYDATEYAEKSLFRLFNARYERHRTTSTLVAYNLDREDRLPPFLRSRMRDGRFRCIRLAGADVRPALGQGWENEEADNADQS